MLCYVTEFFVAAIIIIIIYKYLQRIDMSVHKVLLSINMTVAGG